MTYYYKRDTGECIPDEHINRQEVAVGYAVVSDTGFPYPSTVADTKRAAMVNGLASVFGQMVYNFESDERISRRFSEACGDSGIRVSVVLIESVVVFPAEGESG